MTLTMMSLWSEARASTCGPVGRCFSPPAEVDVKARRAAGPRDVGVDQDGGAERCRIRVQGEACCAVVPEPVGGRHAGRGGAGKD